MDNLILKTTPNGRIFYVNGNNEVVKAQCNICNEIKPKEEMIHNKNRKYGITGECKECVKRYIRGNEIPPKKKQLTEKELTALKKMAVKSEIQFRYNNGLPLTYKKVCKEDRALTARAVRAFGTWVKAVEECLGIDYLTISRIELLQEKIPTLPQLNYSYMKSNNHSTLKLAREVYGSWENALKSLGYDYDSIKRKDCSHFGYELEEILISTLTELGCEFTTQDKTIDKSIQPDINLKRAPQVVKDLLEINNSHKVVLIDSKLSRHTNEYCDTERKYLPHCDKLIFVYARDYHKPEKLNDKTLRLPVHYLINLIESDTAKRALTKRLNKLLSECESYIATS